MAIKYTAPDQPPEKGTEKERPAEKIARGLEEAIAIAKSDAEPARIFRTRAPNGTFDRKDYMREYMRHYRSKDKAK